MRVLYGVTGEGMGHAMRSRVVLEHLLAGGHEVEIMASGRACDYLSKRFGGGDASGVTKIHGLHMVLEENRIRRGKTLWSNVVEGMRGLPGNVSAYFELIAQFEPECVISDFESWTYLYGKQHRLPVLSIDNMQIIARCTIPDDVIGDNAAAFQLTKTFIKSKLPFCDAYYVTSFFHPPVRKPDTYLFPPILRPEILAAVPREGEHLLVYQSTANAALEAALRATGLPCRIYGMRPGATEETRDENLWFRTFSEPGFIDDLASCRGVIAGGGFTLMGEAVMLHKPMLAIPIAGQFEQIMNARYLARLGYGLAADLADADVVARFVEGLPDFARALAGYTHDHNRALLAAVDAFFLHAAEPR